MINSSHLNKLRIVSKIYQLPETLQIIRSVNESDGIGGINTDDRVVATVKGRLVPKLMSEEQEGGGVIGNNKYEIVMESDADVRVDDKIKKVNDNFSERYYFVINTDGNATEGLFTTAEAIERYN